MLCLSRLMASFNGFGSRHSLNEPFFFSTIMILLTHSVGLSTSATIFCSFNASTVFLELGLRSIWNSAWLLNYAFNFFVQLHMLLFLVLTYAFEYIRVFLFDMLLGKSGLFRNACPNINAFNKFELLACFISQNGSVRFVSDVVL